MEILASFDPHSDFESLLQVTSKLQDNKEKYPSLFSLSPLSSIADEDDDDGVEKLVLPSPLQVNTTLPINDTGLDSDIISLSTVSRIDNDDSTFLKTGRPASPPPLAAQLSKLEEQEETKEMKRKRINKERSRAARKKKKMAKKLEAAIGDYEVREEVRERLKNEAKPIPCSVDFAVSEVTKAAFVGKDDKKRSRKIYDIEEIRDKQGFTVQSWDGVTPTPIVDQRRRFIGLLAGRPKSDNWETLLQEAVNAMEDLRPRCVLPKPKNKKTPNRRGKFISLSCGVSHGGGQERPGNLCPDGSNKNGPNAKVLKELNNVPIFKRLAGFVSAAIATWAPDLYAHYVQTLRTLHKQHPDLERVFHNSILSAFTYNLGPRTVCFGHKDFANLPYGLCAITSFGNYNPIQGGHLVLWECRLAIEFPPGSTILITSAVVTHSNTSILPHETRYSFAQYTAGGIFRWVEHDCQTSNDYYSKFTPKEKETVLDREAQRWLNGLSLLPIIPVQSSFPDNVAQ